MVERILFVVMRTFDFWQPMLYSFSKKDGLFLYTNIAFLSIAFIDRDFFYSVANRASHAIMRRSYAALAVRQGFEEGHDAFFVFNHIFYYASGILAA